MSTEREQLEAGIAALEAQRALLGDAVAEAALVPLRRRLAALSAASTTEQPSQTLRQVSILFLDIVGSTTLSERLDPEEIHGVIDNALQRCTAIVQSHGGKVLQYAGDSLLAVFGAAQAREDDPERAVSCGLALLAEGRLLGREVEHAHAHPGFDVRVGVHTGEVLLGGGVDAEGSIRGIAVNIAARMEQTAPAGGLRISHDTHRHVRGEFDAEPQAPIEVKGIDAPIVTYLVRGAKPRALRSAGRGIEGVQTRMIGREAELRILQAAHARLLAEHRLAVITVTADAGIGKTRLLREFEAWARDQPERTHVLHGRATPQTENQPYGLLRDVLALRFQIADDDTLEAARAKLEQGIVPLFLRDDGPDLAQGHAHLLGHLIGIDFRESRHLRGILDDARQIRSRALHAAAQIFRRTSAGDGKPIVLLLEDLHFADDETLDFLGHLAEVNREVPLLILGSARPTLFERRGDWQGTEGIHHRIDLQALDMGHSRDLADELLKALPAVPTMLRELLTNVAAGNPFYMEELVNMLIDQGTISVAPEGWTVHTEQLMATQVPPTLTGVLQARLDSLPPNEKLALQEASVIGQVFWDRALIALDEHAGAALPALVRRELTLPRTAAAEGGMPDDLREYAFRHPILHQVTYGTVLKRVRRELHGRLADWLAQLSGVRANDFLGVSAEHYEQAGDTARAAEFHARAAEYAARRLAHERVLSHVQRALGLLDRQPAGPEIDRLRWRLLDARSQTLAMQGDRDAQRADIEWLDRIADALDDDQLRAHAALQRATMLSQMADFHGAEAYARQAVTWAAASGDHEQRVLAQRQAGLALAEQGEWAAGKVLVQDALAEALALGLRNAEARCVNALAMIANGMGDDPLAELALHERSLVLVQSTGDRRVEAAARANLGVGWLDLGDPVQGLQHLQESLRLATANGDRVTQCGLLCHLSTVALLQGDAARARALARSAAEMAQAVEARSWQAVAAYRLGNAELALGEHAAAARAFEDAQARATEIDVRLQHDAAAGLARVALALGDAAAAMHAVERFVAARARGDKLEGDEQRLIEWTCHRTLALAGDARAIEWLELAHAGLQATAAAIGDQRLRDGFLANVAHHREIVAAWNRSFPGDDRTRP